MNRIAFRFLVLLILMTVSSSLVFSQGVTTTSLSGAVVDQTGSVVLGADIVIKNESTGVEFKAASASNGTFSVPALTAGTYTVTVSAREIGRAHV